MTLGYQADETVATYDMNEDAMGLAPFIDDQFEAHPEAVVVYVEDEKGRQATKAEWIKTTLTDDSVVYQLRITFND
jgi:hypothetical protein